MLRWMSSGPAFPESEGWKRVGGGRLEGPGFISTDFDLLLLEQVLADHEIPCQFMPHRPGEGLGVGREGFTGVALYVPDDRYEQAAQLAEDLASAPFVEEEAETPFNDEADDESDERDSEPDDAGHTEENSR